jgi:hypothetical protein
VGAVIPSYTHKLTFHSAFTPSPEPSNPPHKPDTNKLHSDHKFYADIWPLIPFKNYIFAKILINAKLPGIS